MKIEELETGDMVQLKSGGPNMIISGRPTSGFDLIYTNKNAVICVWFNTNGERQSGLFYPSMLVKR